MPDNTLEDLVRTVTEQQDAINELQNVDEQANPGTLQHTVADGTMLTVPTGYDVLIPLLDPNVAGTRPLGLIILGDVVIQENASLTLSTMTQTYDL